MIMNILQQLEQVKAASREMPLTDEKSSEILNKIADALIENTDKIIKILLKIQKSEYKKY